MRMVSTMPHAQCLLVSSGERLWAGWLAGHRVPGDKAFIKYGGASATALQWRRLQLTWACMCS